MQDLPPGNRQAAQAAQQGELSPISRQFWNETLFWATGDGTAVTATATDTIIFPNVTIPANFMQDGRSLRLRVMGKFTTSATPGTMTFRLKWGGQSGTILCASGGIITAASATNALWDLNLVLTTRSNGSAGTIMANGTASMYASTAPTIASSAGASADSAMTAGGVTGPAPVTVDLTADTALSLTANWSVASQSLTGLNYVIESMN